MADFVDSKDCTRDVRAHLKSCKLLTDIESVRKLRKLLITRAGIVKIIFVLQFSITT